MAREFSAGGVLVRWRKGRWWMAVIEPQGRTAFSESAKDTLALPKGLIDPGEKAENTALREIHEETGAVGELIAKLKDIKYFYVRTWGDGARVFKVVSFYLVLYRSGKLGNITPEMRKEVRRAIWLPIDDWEQLSYKGEREVAQSAREYLLAHAELQPDPKATSSES
ncbi:MAG TPA: NUDIX domain-containing protein [Terriglobales bacterium]|nr:NUDIX domain-containing protein [Terriglobales bacterium]